MKVLSVYGYTGSGKTTVVETLIKGLRAKRYSVGSIKEIHFEEFAIDTPGTNTYRHREAGSQLVSARGMKETDILYDEKLKLTDILKHYHHEYVICEGVTDYNLPKILAAKSVDELEKRWERGIFAVSGVIAETLNEYKGVPVINALKEPEKLINLVEEKVFELLPDAPIECCSACGYDCRTLAEKILKGEAKREDCVQTKSKVKLYINDEPIQMVPFVENILKSTCLGLISQFEGYEDESSIRIEINNN